MNLNYENFDNIINCKNFLIEYEKYKNKINYDKLILFLDNLDNNKNYYHLTINKKKIYKKSENNDTIVLKQINNCINKITDETFDNIINDFIKLIKDKEYLYSIIIENIIETSIMNPMYVCNYIKLLKIFDNSQEIEKYCKKYYNLFFNEKIKNSESKYLKLCNINKRTDNIIGFSIFISYLENELIISGYIKKIIDNFFNEKFINKLDDIEFYQYLLSIETIFNNHKDKLNDTYIMRLNEIKKNTKSSKIRFKIMDILDQ